MAKYLDENGLQQVWNKAKETFVEKNDTPSDSVSKKGDTMSGALFFTGGGNQAGTSVSKQDDMLALGTETSKIWLFQAGARAGTLDFSAWVGGQDPTYYFPAKGGTFAMTSDIPSSLPADGGTSDWSKKVWTTSHPNEWWVDFTYKDGYFVSQGKTFDGTTIPLKVAQADNATKVANFGIGDIFNKAQTIVADGSQFACRQMNQELPSGLTNVYDWGTYLSFAQPSARFEMYAPDFGTHPDTPHGIWVRTGWNNDRKDWKRLAFADEIPSNSGGSGGASMYHHALKITCDNSMIVYWFWADIISSRQSAYDFESLHQYLSDVMNLGGHGRTSNNGDDLKEATMWKKCSQTVIGSGSSIVRQFYNVSKYQQGESQFYLYGQTYNTYNSTTNVGAYKYEKNLTIIEDVITKL